MRVRSMKRGLFSMSRTAKSQGLTGSTIGDGICSRADPVRFSWKHRKRVARACVLALTTCVGCSSYAPPSTPAVVPPFELDAPPDRVWLGVLDLVNERNVPV